MITCKKNRLFSCKELCSMYIKLWAHFWHYGPWTYKLMVTEINQLAALSKRLQKSIRDEGVSFWLRYGLESVNCGSRWQNVYDWQGERNYWAIKRKQGYQQIRDRWKSWTINKGGWREKCNVHLFMSKQTKQDETKTTLNIRTSPFVVHESLAFQVSQLRPPRDLHDALSFSLAP